jgi:hypothetical protein
VESLIKKGAVVETEEKGGYVSRYFLVQKKGPNEWRPIINLKPLNQFLSCPILKWKGLPQFVTRWGRSIFWLKSTLLTPTLLFWFFEAIGNIYAFVWGEKHSSIHVYLLVFVLHLGILLNYWKWPSLFCVVPGSEDQRSSRYLSSRFADRGHYYSRMQRRSSTSHSCFGIFGILNQL